MGCSGIGEEGAVASAAKVRLGRRVVVVVVNLRRGAAVGEDRAHWRQTLCEPCEKYRQFWMYSKRVYQEQNLPLRRAAAPLPGAADIMFLFVQFLLSKSGAALLSPCVGFQVWGDQTAYPALTSLNLQFLSFHQPGSSQSREPHFPVNFLQGKGPSFPLTACQLPPSVVYPTRGYLKLLSRLPNFLKLLFLFFFFFTALNPYHQGILSLPKSS